MSYHQITREERYTISALRKQGYRTSRDCQPILGRHRSSIYREIRAKPVPAIMVTVLSRLTVEHEGAGAAHGGIGSSRLKDFAMVESSPSDLDWSPEQVSGYLKRARPR